MNGLEQTAREAVMQERVANLAEATARIERKIDKMEDLTNQLGILAAEWRGTVRGVMIAAPALGGLLGALASILLKKLSP